MTNTLLLKYDWSNAIAFEGKAAADFLKLLDSAKLVTWEHTNQGRRWTEVDPDKDGPVPQIEFLYQKIDSANTAQLLRTRLAHLEQLVERHKDMIDAAEALRGEGSSS